jgi:hypothetical protein
MLRCRDILSFPFNPQPAAGDHDNTTREIELDPLRGPRENLTLSRFAAFLAPFAACFE